MAYFLRHFALATSEDEPSTSYCDRSGSNTLLDLSTGSSLSILKRTHEQAATRECYSEILLKCARIIYKNAILGNTGIAERHTKDIPDPTHDNAEFIADNLKYLQVIAPPSLFGANFLALTTTLKTTSLTPPATLSSITGQQSILNSSHFVATAAAATSTAACGSFIGPTTAIPVETGPNVRSNHLITVGLDSVFSILIELNKRDPELCAQALQQLLQLLQTIPPEGMISESKQVIQKMHDLLKTLRIEGTSTVSSYANACLVSLAVARGEPEMLFSAIQCLLCDEKENIPFNHLTSESNPLPKNFQNLAFAVQRFIQNGPGAFENGSFCASALTDHPEFLSFDLSCSGSISSTTFSEDSTAPKSCLASDGTYLYILNPYGLYKVGTGLTETQASRVLAVNELLKFIDGSALLICHESLYLRRKHSTRLWVIDKETLREIGEIMLHASLTDGMLFADGKSFYQGMLDEHWNFMVTPLDDSFGILINQKHKHSNRLVEFNYAIFGNCNLFQQRLISSIPANLQMQAIDLQFTEDTGFLLTRSGDIFYTGKASAFFLTDSEGTWADLNLSEPIVQMHLDPYANCLLLRSGAGHLRVIGHPIGSLENQISHANNSKKFKKLKIPHKKKGTSVSGIPGALGYVTDNGKCYLFGRHIVSSSNDSGQLTGFDGFSVASLGVGKTHIVAISKTGLVYTCGLNNLNQCGRDEPNILPQAKATHPISPFNFTPTTSTSPSGATSPATYCFPGEHLFIKDAASICMRCGKCSGKSEKCPTKLETGEMRKVYLQRGMMCVCDSQESVCLRCGICQGCAESVNLKRNKHEETEEGAPEAPVPRAPVAAQAGQLHPARLVLQGDIKVSTVSCGNYHTILLCADRSVYTFGSNCHGQLGTGDTEKRSGAYKLNLPSNVQVVQAVAGANHCILRTLDGQIITFGAYKNGQLCRKAPSGTTAADKKWFAQPTFVEGYGQACGTIVSWVAAVGDQTIIQTQKQIFTKKMLNDARVTARKDCLVILPSGVSDGDYVIINRLSGEVSQFKMDESRLTSMSFALDPYYPLLWTFDDQTFRISAFTDSGVAQNEVSLPASNLESLATTLCETLAPQEPDILKRHRELLRCTELCIPSEPDPEFSDTQLAIFLLSTVYSMSVLAATGILEQSKAALRSKLPKHLLSQASKISKLQNFEVNLDHENGGYCALNRFDSFGGGWGYSAHCVEAIQFKVSKPIHLCGVGLFGGRGEYAAKIRLVKVVGGDVDEQCVELLAESDETVYECAPRETAVLQFNKKVLINPEEWHVLWAQIQGPSSDCGACGRPVVMATGDVEFTFRNSILSNNGTDIEVGQIPEIYYTLKSSDETPEELTAAKKPQDKASVVPEDLSLISAQTLFTITPATISNLFGIFDWATKGSFAAVPQYAGLPDDEEMIWKQERFGFVAIITLRMLRLYIAILSSQDPATESEEGDASGDKRKAASQLDAFANLIIDFSGILKNIFSIADEKLFIQDKIGALVIHETVDAYVACAELLLPSPIILRNRFSQAIAREQRNWSLLALLRACEKLESLALNVLIPDASDKVLEDVDNKPSDNLGDKLSRYFYPTQNGAQELTGSGIIRFLFDLGFATKESTDDDILFNRLKEAALKLIVVYAKTLVVTDLKNEAGPPLQATDTRFRRFNSHLNWETGNGAYDAIAFKVDDPGVTIHGVGIFIGAAVSGDFTFELETLVNTGDIANECWSLIEQQSGTIRESSIANYSEAQSVAQQKLVSGIKLQKPMALKPNVTYAVRIHLSAGKTFYGENGQSLLKLSNGSKLHFLPCNLSKNGTSIVRGQLPYLVYSIEEPKKTKDENPEALKFWEVENKTHNLFIEIMRLLSQKLSYLMALSRITGLERAICGQLISYCSVFLEANPNLSFNVISAIDEVIPLITTTNADEIRQIQKFPESSVELKRTSQSLGPTSGIVQTLVESPHPYRSGQMFSQIITFEPTVEFMCIRFHDECQTAQPDDCLWIYLGHYDSTCFYPIGKYHGTKNWPEFQLLLPGNKLWFVLETALPGEELDPTSMYGFRCTVDGYCSRPEKANSLPNGMLEQQFAWLVSSACRLLVQAPGSLKNAKKMQEREEVMHEIIRKHGTLLKKGLHIDQVPSIKDVMVENIPSIVHTPERTFLDEFIQGLPDTPAGRLARALSFDQSFLDLSLSTIEIEASEIAVGKPVSLVLVQKDQFNKDTKCTNLAVEIFITSADDVVTHDFAFEQDLQNQNSPQPTSSNSSLTAGDQQNWKIGHVIGNEGFRTLKQLQLKERSSSIYLNKARYKTITMNPAFANYSLEELRFAFQKTIDIKENYKLDYNHHTGFFVTDWKPKKSGRFRIDCTIDGFKLGSTTFIEVNERRTPCVSPRSIFTQEFVEKGPKIKKAFMDPFSRFMAVRVRAHPSLSAPAIGIINRGCTITWEEWVKNSDGTWLKLTDEAKALFCDKTSSPVAWCLQYHKAFERTLLEVDEKDLVEDRKDNPADVNSKLVKSPRRMLPPLPPKPKTFKTELTEDADILTVNRASTQASSSSGHYEALSPKLIDCCRSVFAALIWHERLSSDLMTAANHLKSSPQIEQLFYDLQNPALPSCFPQLIRLYRSTVQCVLEIVDQHLILPTVPSMKQLSARHVFLPSDEVCELCRELHPKPITVHMRERHPGCGAPCLGHGYNSIGHYTTGWTGLCGDGGKSNAVWYLMCPSCRTGYLNKTGNSEQKDEINLWPATRPRMDNKQLWAESILKDNASFLLDLRPCEDATRLPVKLTPKRVVHTYRVSLHPQSASFTPKEQIADDGLLVDTDYVGTTGLSPLHQMSHQSDPGKLAQERSLRDVDPFSLSASANLFRRPQQPVLPPLPQRLTSLNGLTELLRHPVLLFCVETHNLQTLRRHFYRSICRATKFAYSFRVWNWLLKLVTSETIVTDIVWNYLAALASYSPYNHWLNVDMKFATKLKLLPHPWRLCFLAGTDVSGAMIEEMHAFLGTLAVILQSSGVDMSLKCLCFKAWTFHLTMHEQNLLITMCNILSAVGAVLSDASSDVSSLFDESALSILAGFGPTTSGSLQPRLSPKRPPICHQLSSSHFHALNQVSIKQHENLSHALKITPSSRPQLCPCLTDGSLETFWESGDEDKNRARRLNLSWNEESYRLELLGIFIDNIRDTNFKVNQITVRNSKNVICNAPIEWTFVGWVKVLITSSDNLQIHLKGSEAGCRIRQLIVFGQKLTVESGTPGRDKPPIKQSNSHQLLFSTAQMDAFILFQAIAAQAFSDELAEEQNGTLRQQVIDMLFNRVQLQPLQSYVCFQMVNAVEREIVSLRDRTKRNYSYVCGLMVMLVKICESRKGLEVFSLRNGLLIILSELLLFAPQIVQLQTIETMTTLLKHFKPTTFDCSQFIRNILASIAKAIVLQIKDKITRKISSQRIDSHACDVPSYWRIDKPISVEIAQMLVKFIGDITTSKFTDHWSIVVKTELANTIMQLAQFVTLNSSSSSNLIEPSVADAVSRTAHSLKTSQFWLAVAAVALINDPKWLELAPAWKTLKARRSQEPDPLCENHDDGQTLAHFRCDVCLTNLCRECFTILHLNKTKKSHTARLIGSSTFCPKVDVHEGCTRLKLNNLLVLFNTSKLSGMVEISADIGSGAQTASYGPLSPFQTAKCRFCLIPLKTESESMMGVCGHEDCLALAADSCGKILSCGHFCGGIRDEEECLPCFTCDNQDSKQDSDDLCVICFTDRLGGAPCIKLACGHFFHYKCVKQVLEKRWPGPRILFRFIHCPLCNAQISHPALSGLLNPLIALYQDVSEKAKLRLEYDGLLTSPAITSETSEFHNNPVAFAMEKYVYVLCSKCGKAYFGGEASCQEALDSSTAFNPEELLCGGCSDIAGAEICGRHGVEYLEYKCRFCCSVAVYFCFASTHFCSGCHADFQQLMPMAKTALPQCPVGPRCVQLDGDECPLKVNHPPTGEEFSLGCGICRNIRTF